MNGQTNVYKKTVIENFIKTNPPCKKNEPLRFDLRAYASYVKENNLDASQITDVVLKKFSKA